MEPNRKIKILTISDHPLFPSGVGVQTKVIIEAMLKTGKFQFLSIGGALQHLEMRPHKTQQWGDDWIIFPVHGYGDHDVIRSMLWQHKPDILWFMTDPRYYMWLWEIENEIRPLVPMVYYHVWDNFPYPKYNNQLYKSTDTIVTISKLTSSIVRNVSPDVKEIYLPHSVDTELYKPLPKDEVGQWRSKAMPWTQGKFLFFWNNRNARRKHAGTLLWWFKKFLDNVGHDKACLMMHTDPNDIHGQQLNVLIRDLGLGDQNQVMLSMDKVKTEAMVQMYNAVDCTINIADAEGFGLATFESLACGTPIIVNMTGGLQEQVTVYGDLDEQTVLNRTKEMPSVKAYEHGIGIEPSSRAVIGSQETPYIYEDRINEDDFINALTMMYNASREKRQQWGDAGRQHVLKNYNFDNFVKSWEKIFLDTYAEHGSWETRTPQHKIWEMRKI